MIRHRSRIRFRRLARRFLRADDPPERIARGFAAGVFAAGFPVPGLQIPLGLFFAALARGNKAASILAPLVANASLTAALAWAQFHFGAWLWRGAGDAQHAASAARRLAEGWNWSDPAQSARNLSAVVSNLDAEVCGPLAVGMLASGVVAGVLAYVLSLAALTMFHGYRLRLRAERGIGLRPPRGNLELPEPDAAELSADPLRYVQHPERYVQADTVKLLVDGRQAFPEMLGCIAAARESIDMETYILHSDRTGWRFGAALAAAARRGVKVRLLYDGFGSLGLTQEYVDALLDAGAQVAVFRPLSSVWRHGLGPFNRRNHRKILVIDKRIAFTGGLNIGDENAPPEEGGEGWRDTHLRVDGSAPAREMAGLIEATWRKSERYLIRPQVVLQRPSGRTARVPPATAGETPAVRATPELAVTSANVSMQVLSNKEFLQRVRVRRAYLHAIRRARRYILIENAYFIPDRGIRRALRKAVKRGVTVGVVVAMHSDLGFVALASRALYGDLLASGVRLFEYPVSMMHCKIAVIDDVWSVVSSYNLDHRSLLHNLEAGVLLLDRPFAAALRKQVLADIARCREVTPQHHAARPWNEALMQALAYQARYWL